jgi:serine/threonine protein kinase
LFLFSNRGKDQDTAIADLKDIWSIGAVLYEMVTGRRPFESCTTSALAGDILYKPAASPRQFNPDISPRLEEVILKCLETRTATNRRRKYWLACAAAPRPPSRMLR